MWVPLMGVREGGNDISPIGYGGCFPRLGLTLTLLLPRVIPPSQPCSPSPTPVANHVLPVGEDISLD